MTAGASDDGKRSEKIEVPEDSLRTVECLRGRLLAERVASRNAKEEAEQMENKLIELEKKLKEESKSRNRAEKKLKFLLKKLESLNISYISDESEQSASGSLEKSEICSVVSSVASSSTKDAEDKESNANLTNSVIGDTQESIQYSKSPAIPENLQQNVSSSVETHDNPSAGEIICSNNGVNLPESTIQKEETEEFKESEAPTDSNNSKQNASPSNQNHDNPAARDTVGSRNGANFAETMKKEDIEEFEVKIECPTVPIKSEQNQNATRSTTLNKCHSSPTTELETFSFVEAHSAKSNKSESSQKAKKDDHSLRSLFKKENLNEKDDQEHDQVDNSLALVPVDLPKPKQSIDPAILDATVKEVLDALRNAKEKLQTSMERRRNNMIKVG